MECPACGHRNRPHRRYCVECGAALPPEPARASSRRCASCGAASEPAEKFCGHCGHALPAAGAAAPTAIRIPYTPRHLAERILGSRRARAGERKQVTVLFADVKGSMELAEQLDPEEW